MADINWGVIDPSTPARVAGAYQAAQEDMAKNALLRAQLEHAQGANELAKYQLSQARRGDEAQNALADVYRGAFNAQTGDVDQNALLRGLAERGVGYKIPEVQAQLLKAQKEKADLGKTETETSLKRSQAIGSALVAAHSSPDDETILRALSTLDALGIPTAKTRQIFAQTPDAEARRQIIKSFAFGTPEGLKALEAIQVKPEKVDTGGSIGFVNVNPLAGQVGMQTGPAIKTTMTPGQAAQLAQSERHFQTTQATPNLQHVETQGGMVAFNPKTGTITPITDYKGEAVQGNKGLTEVQAKGTLFASRAEKSDQLLNQLEGKYSPLAVATKQGAGKVPGIGGALEVGANVLLPAEAQKAEQAQRDFVNAILRQESGAAISDSEFNNAKRQYFPQPGDSADVVKQKAQNRKTAIEGLKVIAGPGMKQLPKRPPLDSFGSK